MLTERDIERAASFLFNLHGLNAYRVAAFRVSTLLRDGESNAACIWLRIATRLSIPQGLLLAKAA